MAAMGSSAVTVTGIDQLGDTTNAGAAMLATLTVKVDQYMTSAADQAAAISSSLENIRGDIAGFQSSASDAQAASTAAIADLQSKLDTALADQSAEVQRQVQEAVAAMNTEVSNQFAAVVQQAQDVANIVPDAPSAPTEPAPDQPAPPVDQPPTDTPPVD